MAASHTSVGTGGKSRPRFRSSAPGVSSGMASLLYDFQQVAEGSCIGGLRVHEENGGAARAFSRRPIDQLEPVLLHVVVCFADIGDTQRDVPEPAAPAVLLDLLRD